MLMVLIWGKQIQFCFFSNTLKDSLTSGYCGQTEFLPVVILLLFLFFCPSSLTFCFGLIWNETNLSDTVCFEILNCAVDFPEGALIIDSMFAYLTGFVSLKLIFMFSFLFLFNPCLFLMVLVWSTSQEWIVSFGRDPAWLTMALCAAAPSSTRFRSWQLLGRLVSHAHVRKARHRCELSSGHQNWILLCLPKYIV